MSEQKSSAVVHRYLSEAITGGIYQPGTKLPTERALSTQFGVPRSTVRDALSILEAEQRIVRRIGSGTFVSSLHISPALASNHLIASADLSPAEIMEARLLIEPRLAIFVVRHAKAADFDRFEECNDRAERANSLEEFEHWDAALHQAIADAAQNRLIVSIYGMITAARDHTEWGELKRRSVNAERRAAYQVEHRAIVAALRARDADAAERAIADHLERVRRNLLGY
ncbi:MAG TPA: FCD domain-containing protein [Stellaceae bacterium]|nr:FCD domain-containing protein [Stellaceae bacterium]